MTTTKIEAKKYQASIRIPKELWDDVVINTLYEDYRELVDRMARRFEARLIDQLLINDNIDMSV